VKKLVASGMDRPTCPVCGRKSLEIREIPYDVPGFGKTLIITMYCPSCGLRHRDVLCLEFGEPKRYEFVVERPEDLKVRVIRSSSATIRIPELGVLIEPGPASEGFISNIEGILDRVEGVVAMMGRFAETPEEKARASEALAKIWDAREGRLRFTLIIDDPLGNSLSAPPDKSRLRVRRLTKEEVERLKSGPFISIKARLSLGEQERTSTSSPRAPSRKQPLDSASSRT